MENFVCTGAGTCRLYFHTVLSAVVEFLQEPEHVMQRAQDPENGLGKNELDHSPFHCEHVAERCVGIILLADDQGFWLEKVSTVRHLGRPFQKLGDLLGGWIPTPQPATPTLYVCCCQLLENS